VNSNDHWSPLEEVVLGVPFLLDYTDDISFRLFYHDNLLKDANWSIFRGWREGLVPDNRLRDECEEDLAGIEVLLRDAGITVRRPEMTRGVSKVVTPYWEAPTSHALMCRDLFLILGEEIIETPVMVRSRYFEQDLYKDLLLEYFAAGARWTCAPRSRLRDVSFDYSYVRSQTPSYPETSGPLEPMFDGAQILKVGRDLFFNCSTQNHRLGLQWLTRHVGSAYRIHEIFVADNHVDSRILPLRPGLLLVHEGVRVEALPPPIRDWDTIVYERLEKDTYPSGGAPLMASTSIGMNVLSLDPERVLVQDIQTKLIRDLERSGLTPIPCRWRHGRRLGGGLHCLTLDIRRRGQLQDYS
jgi:glycine amidinotransferase